MMSHTYILMGVNTKKLVSVLGSDKVRATWVHVSSFGMMTRINLLRIHTYSLFRKEPFVCLEF